MSNIDHPKYLAWLRLRDADLSFSIRDQNTTLIALDDDYEPMIFSRVVGTYRTAFALLLITQFDRAESALHLIDCLKDDDEQS